MEAPPLAMQAPSQITSVKRAWERIAEMDVAANCSQAILFQHIIGEKIKALAVELEAAISMYGPHWTHSFLCDFTWLHALDEWLRRAWLKCAAVSFFMRTSGQYPKFSRENEMWTDWIETLSKYDVVLFRLRCLLQQVIKREGATNESLQILEIPYSLSEVYLHVCLLDDEKNYTDSRWRHLYVVAQDMVALPLSPQEVGSRSGLVREIAASQEQVFCVQSAISRHMQPAPDPSKALFEIEDRAVAVLARFFAVAELTDNVHEHWIGPVVQQASRLLAEEALVIEQDLESEEDDDDDDDGESRDFGIRARDLRKRRELARRQDPRLERRQLETRQAEIRALLDSAWEGHEFTHDDSEYMALVYDQVWRQFISPCDHARFAQAKPDLAVVSDASIMTILKNAQKEEIENLIKHESHEAILANPFHNTSLVNGIAIAKAKKFDTSNGNISVWEMRLTAPDSRTSIPHIHAHDSPSPFLAFANFWLMWEFSDHDPKQFLRSPFAKVVELVGSFVAVSSDAQVMHTSERFVDAYRVVEQTLRESMSVTNVDRLQSLL